LANAEIGETITMNLRSSASTLIPAAVLRELQGSEVDLVVSLGRYSWTINGTEVQENARPANMAVTLLQKDEELTEAAESKEVMMLKLSHSGNFGFSATLNWPVGRRFAGQTMYLHYFNEETERLEYVSQSVIDRNGFGRFAFNHASRYVLSTYLLAELRTFGEATEPEGETEAAPEDYETAEAFAPEAITLRQEPLLLNETSANFTVNDGSVVAQPFMWQYEGGFRVGMVSLRVVAEFFGGVPAFANGVATITGTARDGSPVTIILTEGNSTALINGIEVDIALYSESHTVAGAVMPVNFDNRIYVPMRFVVKAFGYNDNLTYDGFNVIVSR
jgi:hypothetical protein